MILSRAALGLALAVLPLCAAAQPTGPNDVAPVPLMPLIAGVPNAPLPAAPVPSAPSGNTNGRALPAPDLPAPDLPATSMVVPPGPGRDAPMTQQTPGQQSQAQAAPDSAAPAQVKPVWNPRGGAVLDVLDKEDGAVHRITVAAGSQVTEGKLAIAVAACMVRPPDMTPDAAMFVTVTPMPSAADAAASSTAPSPVFRGWLIRSEPGATVIGDAAVTFRLIGCNGS